VANYGSGTVTPITVATNTAGTPINVGTHPVAIAITPNGLTAYVVNYGSYNVTPPSPSPPTRRVPPSTSATAQTASPSPPMA
jgi:YVTN family beta-propeller protein